MLRAPSTYSFVKALLSYKMNLALSHESLSLLWTELKFSWAFSNQLSASFSSSLNTPLQASWIFSASWDWRSWTSNELSLPASAFCLLISFKRVPNSANFSDKTLGSISTSWESFCLWALRLTGFVS